MTDQIVVTRATLAELAAVLAQAGHGRMLTEDGTIHCGNIVIGTATDDVPTFARAARTAQVIDDLAIRDHCPPSWKCGDTEISVHPTSTGCVVIRRDSGQEARSVELPRDCLALVVEGVIDAMAAQKRVDDVVRS